MALRYRTLRGSAGLPVMRILFVSGWFPYPPDNGSKLRIYNLLTGLAKHHEIVLDSFADRPVGSLPPEIGEVCSEVHVVPGGAFQPARFRSLAGWLSANPRAIVGTHVPQMAQRIRRELGSGRYDLVIACQWIMAAHLPADLTVPALFEEVELGALEAKRHQARNPWGRLRHELSWRKFQAYLRRLMPRFAAATVVSEEEAGLLRRAVPGYEPIHVVPNCISLASYRNVKPSATTARGLVFAGSPRYSANHEAMSWFLREVYPLVQAQVPDVHLTITGDRGSEPLPPSENVTFTGMVPDVRPLIASSPVSLAPIRQGGGTRLKILEAMALGSSVVSTSKGAEGLAVRHEEHLLLADTPAAFSTAVVRLLRDPELRRRLSQQAYLLVQDRYDWEAEMPRYLDLVERVGRAGARKPHSMPLLPPAVSS